MQPSSAPELRHLTCQIWMPRTPPSELSHLLPVLHQLAEVHDEYHQQESEPKGQKRKLGDTTFWYRERPQVGWFAAAVWKSGGIALEEYKAIKLTSGTKKPGRGDLFFKFKGVGYMCESKHAWISTSNNDRNLKPFIRAFRASAKDASRAQAADHKLALTFGSVVVETGKSPKARSGFQGVVDQLLKDCVWKPNTIVLALALKDRPMRDPNNTTSRTHGLIACIQLGTTRA